MTFALETNTNAKLHDVSVLSDKDRAPDTNPGAGLDFSFSASNEVLIQFDGKLRGMLFTKTAASAGQQAALEGVLSDMPNLTEIGKRLGQFGWDQEFTGYTLVIDQGLGDERSNIELDDCKLSNFRFHCKEGGSTIVKFRAEAPDVSEKQHGQLALLKGIECPITLAPPVVKQDDLPLDEKPRKSGRQTKGQAMAAQLGQDEGATAH